MTENDFAQIAAAGLNHVRLPIGYWAFDVSAGELDIQDVQYDYLKKTANHGLHLIVGMSVRFYLVQSGIVMKHPVCRVGVDLHGVPGLQNGFDNSAGVCARERPAIPAVSSDTLSNHASIVPVRSLRDSRQSSLRPNIDPAYPPCSPRTHIAQIPVPMNEPAGFPPPSSPLRVNIGSTTFVPMGMRSISSRAALLLLWAWEEEG